MTTYYTCKHCIGIRLLKEFQAGIVKHSPSERDILVCGSLSGQRPLFHNTEIKSRDLR